MRTHQKTWIVAISILGALYGGCSDDDGGNAPGGDAGASDAAGPIDAGPDGTTSDASVEPRPQLLVTTTNFAMGGLGTMDLETNAVTVSPTVAADQDTVPIVTTTTRPLLLERGLGNVRLQSRTDLLTTTKSFDVDPVGSTGPYASNPVDVVEVSGLLYVVLQRRSEIAVLNPALDGAAARIATIDLSPLAGPGDTDSVDAAGAVAHAGRLYVMLGRYAYNGTTMMLDFFGGSIVAVIDTATRELVDMDSGTAGVQGIELMYDNPHAILADGERNQLIVASSGQFGAEDGGVEAISLGASPTSTVIVTEDALDGELGYTGMMALQGTSSLLVLASNTVRRVALADNTLEVAPVFTGLSSFVLYGGVLYGVSSSTSAPGLRTFSLGTMTETTPSGGPIQFGPHPIAGVVAVLPPSTR